MRTLTGILLFSITLTLTTLSNAAAKQLRCEETSSDGETMWIRDFIFDTKDFAKETPEADTILVETSQDPNEIWIEADNGLGLPVTTFYEIKGVGKTYRTTFEVTPTFLTFMVVHSPDCVSKIVSKISGYNASTRSVCELIMKPRPLSISRKTLKDSKEVVTCEISDYNAEDNLI